MNKQPLFGRVTGGMTLAVLLEGATR